VVVGHHESFASTRTFKGICEVLEGGGIKAFIAQHASNYFHRFLAVAEYRGGGRRGFVIILEGRGGSSWSGFTLNVHRLITTSAYPTTTNRP
jgi:hypothetical protein